MKLDILAIGAHPDDIELSCGATLAKEIAAGKKAGALDLTRGELGTRGSAELRDKEAKAASQILGLEVRDNLGLADGFFRNDKESQLKIIQIIRKYRPEIVFCNAVTDRHIDHGRGSTLASDSCFLSGLVKIQTFDDGKSQEPWRPKHVYHYIQWKNLQPDFLVDVSGFIEKKIEAVMAYGSQFYNSDSSEAETPISSKTFQESINYRARDLGRLIHTDYAEGFTVERPVAVSSVFDLL
ncbi:MAG: bacillithiol biosynthesis deacetylase BshB1 [Leeuwenhoekiella sp.]